MERFLWCNEDTNESFTCILRLVVLNQSNRSKGKSSTFTSVSNLQLNVHGDVLYGTYISSMRG